MGNTFADGRVSQDIEQDFEKIYCEPSDEDIIL